MTTDAMMTKLTQTTSTAVPESYDIMNITTNGYNLGSWTLPASYTITTTNTVPSSATIASWSSADDMARKSLSRIMRDLANALEDALNADAAQVYDKLSKLVFILQSGADSFDDSVAYEQSTLEG